MLKCSCIIHRTRFSYDICNDLQQQTQWPLKTKQIKEKSVQSAPRYQIANCLHSLYIALLRTLHCIKVSCTLLQQMQCSAVQFNSTRLGWIMGRPKPKPSPLGPNYTPLHCTVAFTKRFTQEYQSNPYVANLKHITRCRTVGAVKYRHWSVAIPTVNVAIFHCAHWAGLQPVILHIMISTKLSLSLGVCRQRG